MSGYTQKGAVSPREWTFAMVDLAGFTALTEWHGDEQAADLATRFADLARSSLSPGDRLVKEIGDAVLLAAPDPRAGLAMVSRLLAACDEWEGFPIARAGMHHGSAVERGGDMFGATVNLTARITGHAGGGQVLATERVAEVAGRQGLAIASLGEAEFRNVSGTRELFEIDLQPRPSTWSVDPVCRMRVDHHRAHGRLRHQDRYFWFCSLDCAAAFAAEPQRFAPDV